MPRLFPARQKMGFALFHGRQRLLGSRRSRSQRARLPLTNARHPRPRRLLRPKNADRRQRQSHPVGLDHRKAPRRRTARRRLGRLHVPPAHSQNRRRQHSRNGNLSRSPLAPPTNLRDSQQIVGHRSHVTRARNRNQKSLRRIFLDERREKIRLRPVRSNRPLADRPHRNHRRQLQTHRKRQNHRNSGDKTPTPRFLPLPRRQRRRINLRQPPRHHHPHLPPPQRPPKNHLRHRRKKPLPTLRLATPTNLPQPPHHVAQLLYGRSTAAPQVRKIPPSKATRFSIFDFRFSISPSLHSQLLHPLLIEIPLPIKPNLTPLPLALLIHHPILRNRHQRQQIVHKILRQQHRKRIVLILHIRPDIRRGIVDVKRHHLYVAAILHQLIKLLQIRMLCLARPAPRRPNIDQHRLAFEIHQFPRLALQIRQAPRRQIFAGLLPSRIAGDLRVRHSCQPRLPAFIASAEFLPKSRVTLFHLIHVARRHLEPLRPRINRRPIHEHRIKLVPVHFRPLSFHLPDIRLFTLFVIQRLHLLHRRLRHLRPARLARRVNQEIRAR